MARPLFTIGHGTADAVELTGLLRGGGVTRLVDVRAAPGSRRNPDVARCALADWLPRNGTEYRWERRQGGWRKAPPDSPDTVLRNRSFAGYAAHMRSPEFLDAVEALLDEAASAPTAVLCSESVWWRCHRRMIADFAVLSRRVPVCHLMRGSRCQEHHLTDGARLTASGLLVYDGGQETTRSGRRSGPVLVTGRGKIACRASWRGSIMIVMNAYPPRRRQLVPLSAQERQRRAAQAEEWRAERARKNAQQWPARLAALRTGPALEPVGKGCR